jgi:hypothetical protein
MTAVVNQAVLKPDGSYEVIIPHEDMKGATTFTIREIERLKRSEFTCHLEAIVHDGTIVRRVSRRINLGSGSAQDALAKLLSRLAKGQEFDTIVSKLIEIMTGVVNKVQTATPVTQIEVQTKSLMLFHPFIVDDSSNLFFGDGSSTKSFSCIHLAVSLASGVPFLGFKPSRTCNALYLDYEDRGGKFRDRVDKVCGGMQFPPNLEDLDRLYYMHAKGVPLADLVPQLKEEIYKHKIEVLFVDSVAYACGMEIEKAEAAIRYFNALDSLEITSVSIAHVPKASVDPEGKKGQQTAIGSTFFNNGPRNTWNVLKQGDEEDTDPVKKVMLFNRKCNDGPRHRSIPVEVDFSKPSAVSIRVGTMDDWEESRPLPVRILSFLRSGAKSRSQIGDEFSAVNKETLKSALRRLVEKGSVKRLGGEGGDYALA